MVKKKINKKGLQRCLSAEGKLFELTKFLFYQKVTVLRSKHVQKCFWGQKIIAHASVRFHEQTGLLQHEISVSNENSQRPALR